MAEKLCEMTKNEYQTEEWIAPIINGDQYKLVWLRFTTTSDNAKAIYMVARVNGVQKNLTSAEVYGAVSFVCSKTYEYTTGWFVNATSEWRAYIQTPNAQTTVVVLALCPKDVNIESL